MAYNPNDIAGKKAKNAQPAEKAKKGVLSVVLNFILIVFSVTCMFPLVWMLYSSLKLSKEFQADIIALPKAPTLENYIYVASDPNSHIWTSLFASFRTTIISIVFIVLFSFIVGYILSRIGFKFNRLIYAMFLLGMLIPIHSLLVPIVVVFQKCHMYNKWFTLLLPYISFGLPIGIFLIESYLKGIPVELEEAAAIDGSSFSHTLFTIILPVCKPILATVGIIQTFACWNEFSFALVLINDVKYQTVPLALTNFSGQFTTNYPRMMAAMLITMAPIIILYFLFSKQIIKGMVAGAVKG